MLLRRCASLFSRRANFWTSGWTCCPLRDGAASVSLRGYAPLAYHYTPPWPLFLPDIDKDAALRTRSLKMEGQNGARGQSGVVAGCGARGPALRVAWAGLRSLHLERRLRLLVLLRRPLRLPGRLLRPPEPLRLQSPMLRRRRLLRLRVSLRLPCSWPTHHCRLSAPSPLLASGRLRPRAWESLSGSSSGDVPRSSLGESVAGRRFEPTAHCERLLPPAAFAAMGRRRELPAQGCVAWAACAVRPWRAARSLLLASGHLRSRA